MTTKEMNHSGVRNSLSDNSVDVLTRGFIALRGLDVENARLGASAISDGVNQANGVRWSPERVMQFKKDFEVNDDEVAQAYHERVSKRFAALNQNLVEAGKKDGEFLAQEQRDTVDGEARSVSDCDSDDDNMDGEAVLDIADRALRPAANENGSDKNEKQLGPRRSARSAGLHSKLNAFLEQEWL